MKAQETIWDKHIKEITPKMNEINRLLAEFQKQYPNHRFIIRKEKQDEFYKVYTIINQDLLQ